MGLFMCKGWRITSEAVGTELAKSLRMGDWYGGRGKKKKSPGFQREESFWETMESGDGGRLWNRAFRDS